MWINNRKYWINLFAISMLFLIANTCYAENLQLAGINVTSNGNQTHVVFAFNSTITHYKVFTLTNPNRVAIDLPSVKLATLLNQVSLANTPILHIRDGHPTPNILRIVLDFTKPQQAKAFIFPGNNNRLVVNLNTVDSFVTTKQIETQKTNKAALQQTQEWTQENLQQATEENSPTTQFSQSDNTPIVTAPHPQIIKKTTTVVSQSTQKNASPTEQTTKNSALPSSQLSPNNSQPTITSQPHDLNINKPTTSDKTPIAKPPSNTKQSIPASSIVSLPNSGRRSIIVVIDPGHGGKDPGTTGPLGIHEKDVVLAISLCLRDALAKQPGFHAALTRSADYFIPLRGRLTIARQDRGDIFIAIHADAYKDFYASGASVYALSAHGASSEAARWLAEKENYSELGGVSLSDKSDLLRYVLIDLSQTATIGSSLQLGSSLLQHLNKVGELHHNYVEQAPFMVLKSPDIPSVLVETGFLSNPEEEERLRNPLHQEEIANALAKGIENYFWNNPPPGTLIAALKSGKNKS